MQANSRRLDQLAHYKLINIKERNKRDIGDPSITDDLYREFKKIV